MLLLLLVVRLYLLASKALSLYPHVIPSPSYVIPSPSYPVSSDSVIRRYTDLRLIIVIFFSVHRCMDALKKNRSLIKPDQQEYQKELEKNYHRFTDKLKPMFSSRQAQTLTLSKR